MLDFFPFVMRTLLTVLLLISIAQWANGSSPAVAQRPARKSNFPNVILITLDTTRADRMGFLGSKRGLTPNLDALAQQSAVFTRAYAQVPLTTPSHAALFTGTYPQFNHLDYLGMPLANDLPYVPDLLHRQGYHTAAFLGANVLDAKGGMASGFDRGFDVYDTDFRDAQPGMDRYHTVERRASDVADRALRWLKDHPQGPWFLWLHFYDPHDPYDPPAPFKERYTETPYDGEIAYVDSVIGTFMNALRERGLYQNSLIAIAADHGEAFGEHGEERHGMLLYDETVHVPLLLKLPGQKFAGKQVDARVALVDIAPSLLQGAGIPVPSKVQGQSLLPLLEMETKADLPGKVAERAVFSSSSYARRVFGASELRSWRTGKYLYVQAPRRELYDVPQDPQAAKNLATSSKAVADALDGQLSDFLGKTSSAAVKEAKLDPVVVQKLHALGYMASDNTAGKKSGKGDVDPKDKVEVANRYARALIMGEEGRLDEQIAELRDILKHDRSIPGVEFTLGSALVQQQKPEEALPYLRAAVESWPDSSGPHYELGLAWTLLGRLDDALREMRAAVVCSPSSANLHYLVAGLYTNMQQLPEAMAAFRKALELDPNHFESNLNYGRLLVLQDRVTAARPFLERAEKVNPNSADVHLALADLYDRLGLDAKAGRERDAFQRLRMASPQ